MKSWWTPIVTMVGVLISCSDRAGAAGSPRAVSVFVLRQLSPIQVPPVQGPKAQIPRAQSVTFTNKTRYNVRFQLSEAGTPPVRTLNSGDTRTFRFPINPAVPQAVTIG